MMAQNFTDGGRKSVRATVITAVMVIRIEVVVIIVMVMVIRIVDVVIIMVMVITIVVVVVIIMVMVITIVVVVHNNGYGDYNSGCGDPCDG